jgi:hypothetical protein
MKCVQICAQKGFKLTTTLFARHHADAFEFELMTYGTVSFKIDSYQARKYLSGLQRGKLSVCSYTQFCEVRHPIGISIFMSVFYLFVVEYDPWVCRTLPFFLFCSHFP